MNIVLPVHKPRRGFSLIEILLVMVVLVGLGGFMAYNYLGKGKPGEKKQTPIGRANTVACQSNLQQIRTGVQSFKTMNVDSESANGEAKNPESLKELKFPQDALQCPDGHEPYQYNSQTGEVRCPHPGHEQL